MYKFGHSKFCQLTIKKDYREQIAMKQYYDDKPFILILDNSPIHKSKRGIKLLSAVQYIWLPPYTPQLNPIEKLWNTFKQFMRKKSQIPTLNLHRLFHEHLNAITEEQLNNYQSSVLPFIKNSLDQIDY